MEKREAKTIKSMCSLTEDEVRDRYEKTPSAPIPEESPGKVRDSQEDDADSLKMMDQSRRLLFDKPHSDGLRLRKSGPAGDIAHHDSDEDSDDSDDDRTVLPPADHDYQRPDKLDLLVGFLRLFNFVSCCTSVFAVTLSLLFSVSEPSRDLSSPVNLTTIYTIFSPLTNQTIPSEKSLAFREDDDLLFFIKILASLIILVFDICKLIRITQFVFAGVSHRDGCDCHHRQRGHGHVPVEGVRGAGLPPHRRHLGAVPGVQVPVEVEAPHLPHRGQCLLTTDQPGLMTDHLILSDSHYPLQIILHYYGRSLEQKRSESTGLLLPREVPSLALHALVWYISLMGLGLVSWLIGALLHLIPYR